MEHEDIKVTSYNDILYGTQINHCNLKPQLSTCKSKNHQSHHLYLEF